MTSITDPGGLGKVASVSASASGGQAPNQLAAKENIMIKRVKQGYQVLSTKGKNLGGPYATLEEAKKRLRQVEFFEHHKA